MYDGTRITLAPQTTVTIRERDFTLVGEAFFEVAPQRAVPLVIHTGRTTTRVLGTAFDIRRYPTDPETRVVVREGKVSVGATQRVTLTAGQIAQLTDSTISTATVDDPARYTEWTTGRLVFRNAPAADVLATVGHWYGFQFQLADSVLAKALVTARFDGQSPAAILTALRSLLGVTMTFDGPRVTLRPARGSSATPVRQDLRDTLFLLPAQVGR
jgi:ferric-dicitrate binding protein FerR (iron transport regulator)